MAASVFALSACARVAPVPLPGRLLPRALVREARPIGAGARFRPPARGAVPGPCRERLGARDAVHLELFARNRVVLVAAGIGVRARRAGRPACYGALVTLDPTGVVLVRRGRRATLADLFRAWGQPLTPTRLADFTAPRGTRVELFVDGRRRPGAPGRLVLVRHAEIVLELAPHVPPHSSYSFPRGR